MRATTKALLFLASGLGLLGCNHGPSTTLDTFHLTLPASTLHGTLTASPTEPTGGYSGGTVVTLTAAPASGFQLGKWSGTDDDTSVSLTNQVTMSADKTVGVTFTEPVAQTYLVSLETSGDVTLSLGAVGSQSGPSYTAGTVVPLTATLSAGHTLHWSGTDNDASSATTNTVTLGTSPVKVTATAACDTQCTLTVAVDFPDFGHLTLVDGSVNMDTAGNLTKLTVTKGDTVHLTAHDTPSWPFQGWTAPAVANGNCVGIVVMNADERVSVSFRDLPGQAQRCP